ncbi:MAG: hypothetical protein Q8P07_04855 [bacterium]|nr:hypothetical protein [bacterium]
MKIFLACVAAFVVFTTYIASEEQRAADKKMDEFVADRAKVWDCVYYKLSFDWPRRYRCTELSGRQVLVEQYKNDLMFAAKRASRRKVILWPENS